MGALIYFYNNNNNNIGGTSGIFVEQRNLKNTLNHV